MSSSGRSVVPGLVAHSQLARMRRRSPSAPARRGRLVLGEGLLQDVTGRRADFAGPSGSRAVPRRERGAPYQPSSNCQGRNDLGTSQAQGAGSMNLAQAMDGQDVAGLGAAVPIFAQLAIWVSPPGGGIVVVAPDVLKSWSRVTVCPLRSDSAEARTLRRQVAGWLPLGAVPEVQVEVREAHEPGAYRWRDPGQQLPDEGLGHVVVGAQLETTTCRPLAPGSQHDDGGLKPSRRVLQTGPRPGAA